MGSGVQARKGLFAGKAEGEEVFEKLKKFGFLRKS